MTDVRPGQTWASTRNPGRTIRTGHNLTNTTDDQAVLDQAHGQYHPGRPAPAGKYYGDKRGTTTKIAVTTLARKEWQIVQEAR